MKELVLTKKEGETIKEGSIGILATEEYYEGDIIIVDEDIIGFIKTHKVIKLYKSQRGDFKFAHENIKIESAGDFRDYDDEHYTLIMEYYSVNNPKVGTLIRLETKEK